MCIHRINSIALSQGKQNKRPHYKQLKLRSKVSKMHRWKSICGIFSVNCPSNKCSPSEIYLSHQNEVIARPMKPARNIYIITYKFLYACILVRAFMIYFGGLHTNRTALSLSYLYFNPASYFLIACGANKPTTSQNTSMKRIFATVTATNKN